MNKTIMVLAVLPLFVTGCAKDCGGTFDKWFGRSDCKVESNTSTQTSESNTTTDTEIENKIVVSVDKSLLDPAKEYNLMTTKGTTKLVSATSQTVITDSYNTDSAKEMTLVAVTDDLGHSLLLAAVTKDQKKTEININTTADVMLLSTAKMMGVRVTNYPEFSRRVRLYPEFQEIKDAISKEIKEKSPCPTKSTCNTTAGDAADRLMDQVDVTDIITAEGV